MSPVFSGVASGLNTIIKVCEISLALKAVKEQTTSLLSTTQHVERNILEVKRLMQQKSTLLSFEETTWMERQTKDTEEALSEVAKLVEAARVSIQTSGSADLKTKAVWVFRDSLKTGEKMMRLNVCAGTLSAVISALYAKDAVVMLPTQKVAAEEDDDLRDMDNDGLPSYQMSQLLLNRKTSRMRLKSLDMSPTASLSALIEESFDKPEGALSKGIRLPIVTILEVERDNRSPTVGSTLQASKALTAIPSIEAASLDTPGPNPPESFKRTPRRRRSWLTYHATRSNSGGSDVELA